MKMKPEFVTITMQDAELFLQFPRYDKDEITEFKSTFAASERRWDEDRHVWVLDDAQLLPLLDFLKRHRYSAISITAAEAEAEDV